MCVRSRLSTHLSASESQRFTSRSHEGWFRSGSWYVKAQKHPLLTAAAVAGLGTAAWLLGKSSRDGQNGTAQTNSTIEANGTAEANLTDATTPIEEVELTIVEVYGEV